MTLVDDEGIAGGRFGGTWEGTQISRLDGLHTHLLDAVHESVIATDLNGRVIYWNRFAENLYGWKAEEALGRNILDLNICETGRPEAERLLELLARGDAWSGEIVLSRKDGSRFPAHVSDGPILGKEGRLIGVVGISYDITARREAEEKKQLLIRELHHRVKNTLATIQGVLTATARGASSVEEFSAAFSGRVASLAKTHALLTDDPSQSVSFEDLLRAELAPFDDDSHHRVTLKGPEVILPSNIAVPLGMAIHELTANAFKHGSLADPDGRVSVRWKRLNNRHSETLQWVWNEHDGPPVKLPSKEGFGTNVLNRLLGRQLRAKVQIDYDPDGLRVSVTLPLQHQK